MDINEIDEFFQGLLLKNTVLQEYLTELTVHASRSLSPRRENMPVVVTLLRRRKAPMFACSSEATKLMGLPCFPKEGPGLSAAQQQRTVYVPDFRSEQRWPHCAREASEKGMAAALAIPLALKNEALGALSLYTTSSGGFDPELQKQALEYIDHVSTSVRLIVRMEHSQDTVEDLQAALQTRTAIDLAVGVIMGQCRCGQEDAFALLRSASNSRNVKLHEVATGILASVSGENVTTHFDQ